MTNLGEHEVLLGQKYFYPINSYQGEEVFRSLEDPVCYSEDVANMLRLYWAKRYRHILDENPEEITIFISRQFLNDMWRFVVRYEKYEMESLLNEFPDWLKAWGEILDENPLAKWHLKLKGRI